MEINKEKNTGRVDTEEKLDTVGANKLSISKADKVEKQLIKR